MVCLNHHKISEHIRVLGISKNRKRGSEKSPFGSDRIHFDFTKKTANLLPTHPTYQFLTHMRDEAHRFCNAYQKRKFKKAMSKLDGLEDIRGLGGKRQEIVKKYIFSSGVDGLLSLRSSPKGIPDNIWKRIRQWAKKRT